MQLFTTIILHFALSRLSFTDTHTYIFSHTHSELIQLSAHHQIPRGKNAVANVLRYFFGISVSETKNSVFCVQVTDVQPFLNPLSQPHI